MRRLARLTLLATLALAAPAARAASFEAWLERAADKPPTLVVRTNVGLPPERKQLDFAVTLAEEKGDKVLWQGPLTVPNSPAAAKTGTLPLPQANDATKAYRVTVSGRAPELGVEYREELHCGRADAPLPVYGLRRVGAFPDELLILVLELRGYPKGELRDLPAVLTVRDGDENVVRTLEHVLTPGRQPSRHEFPLAAALRNAIGPFTLDVAVESEVMDVNFGATLRFGWANALAPVTSFEAGDETWYAAPGSPNNASHSLQYYYSTHMTALEPPEWPRRTYDTADAHGGRQALRVEYSAGVGGALFSRQALPGKPLFLRLWVRGNGSDDELWVHFEDFSNLALQAWHRNANFSAERVCRLDFTDWRECRVPVLGGGLLAMSAKGSTPEIDGPVSLQALSVRPGKLGKDEKRGDERRVWVDDLRVETEAATPALGLLEVQNSDAEGRLMPAGQLFVTAGTGLADAADAAVLTLTARDATDKVVWNATAQLAVPAQGFGSAVVPLAPLAATNPVGPVELDVAFSVPKQPGLRANQRLTFKRPTQTGVFEDFEAGTEFNSFRPGRVYRDEILKRVQPGADGRGAALAMTVRVREKEADIPPERKRPNQPPEFRRNSVLFHPALPGLVAAVEFKVKAGPEPVRLQPLFVDSGFTGIWLRPYNVFYPAAVTVDWQEWRTVRVAAPPIPAYHGDRAHYFFRTAWYPLHLALEASVAGETPGELQVDDIRVVTHLPTDQELAIETVYPDASHLHAPGTPLQVRLDHFGAAARAVKLRWSLTNTQGAVTAQREDALTLPPGGRLVHTLLPNLPAGLYELRLAGAGPTPRTDWVSAVDARAYFGDQPLTTLTDPVALRRHLGLLTEKLYLDWDNFEAVPNLLHFRWIEEEAKRRSVNGAYRLLPVLGFCSDWAGPEMAEAVKNGIYTRYMSNFLQVPLKQVDWDRYVRECVREYKERFDEWVFWENPDLEDAPQGVPPARYAAMLGSVAKWVKLYRPQARVVAGGFNFDKALNYLERFEQPEKLPFDDIAVQMNLGELSPEQADLEGFLDELGELLHLEATRRTVQATELDWGIGPYLSPWQQAAYHARAALILNSRGAGEHRFALINTGFEFAGYGVFSRASYGCMDELQTFQPYHLPKPAYFALVQTRAFLKTWRFVAGVSVPDRRLDDNRAFIYRNDAGGLTVALWRTVAGEARYRLPDAWQGATATDAFGYPTALDQGLVLSALPRFVKLPAGAQVPAVVQALRHLAPAAGAPLVLLDLQLGEADGEARAEYKATGTLTRQVQGGSLPGDRKVRETYVAGLTRETFAFTAPAAGHALLARRWFFRDGQKLRVQLNDGAEQPWDLSPGQGNDPGVRESTFVLRGCVAGRNRVIVNYDTPGNCAGYRVLPLAGDTVPLAAWGILNTRQSLGAVQKYRNVLGGPLRVGKQEYSDGLGAHAVGFLEYPLDRQFDRLEVTVGVDGSTEGRGSVVFRVFVDERERANSGTLSGFSAPQPLTVDGLGGARRLVLSVLDAGDGQKHDLANFVNGKLHLRP